MRALILVVLAACTYDEKVLEGPFTCVGQQLPTTAPDLVHITGTLVDGQNQSPVVFASVELQTAPGVKVNSTTTDTNGRFTFDLSTQGVPSIGFNLYASAAFYVPSYYFSSRPISADLEIPQFVIVSMAEETSLFSTAQVTQTSGDGHVLLSINDCIDGRLANATLTASPAGTTRYFTSITPSPTATATDPAGVAMVANLPPGKVTLTGMAQGHAFPPLQVTVVADAFTVTELQP